jgi:hypothetical protein
MSATKLRVSAEWDDAGGTASELMNLLVDIRNMEVPLPRVILREVTAPPLHFDAARCVAPRRLHPSSPSTPSTKSPATSPPTPRASSPPCAASPPSPTHSSRWPTQPSSRAGRRGVARRLKILTEIVFGKRSAALLKVIVAELLSASSTFLEGAVIVLNGAAPTAEAPLRPPLHGLEAFKFQIGAAVSDVGRLFERDVVRLRAKKLTK